MKKRIYVDLDGVMCDYWKRFNQLKSDLVPLPQTTYGFYTSLEPIADAIETYKWLEQYFDVWILTRPSYQNPLCYTEKRVWVEQNLGIKAAQKMIICWNKGLLKGDYLIDDTIIYPAKTQEEIDYMQIPFEGIFMHFGSKDYLTWLDVKRYFSSLLNLKTELDKAKDIFNSCFLGYHEIVENGYTYLQIFRAGDMKNKLYVFGYGLVDVKSSGQLTDSYEFDEYGKLASYPKYTDTLIGKIKSN